MSLSFITRCPIDAQTGLVADAFYIAVIHDVLATNISSHSIETPLRDRERAIFAGQHVAESAILKRDILASAPP